MVITGGCRTQIAGADTAPADVMFTNRAGGLLLSVSNEGQLLPGPALADDDGTRELAALLVEAFGQGYHGALKLAEAKAAAARAGMKEAKARAAAADSRAARLQARIDQLEDAIAARAKPQKEENNAPADR